MSETADVVTKRPKGIASTSAAAASAAALAVTRGRGAPRSIQASRRIRKSGATANVFRSWIRSAKREAKTPTTTSVQTVSPVVAATRIWSGRSSERARASSTIAAATGITPRYTSSSAAW